MRTILLIAAIACIIANAASIGEAREANEEGWSVRESVVVDGRKVDQEWRWSSSDIGVIVLRRSGNSSALKVSATTARELETGISELSIRRRGEAWKPLSCRDHVRFRSGFGSNLFCYHSSGDSAEKAAGVMARLKQLAQESRRAKPGK